MNSTYVSGSINLKLNGEFEIKIREKKDNILKKYSLDVSGKYLSIKANTIKLKPIQIAEQNKKGNSSKNLTRIDEISRQATLAGFYSIVEYADTKILLSHANAFDLATLLNKENNQISLPSSIFRNNLNFDSLFINTDIKENYPGWQKEYILDSPIYCQYIASDHIWHFSSHAYGYFPKYLSTFNKGKSDGLLPGMRLYKNDSGYVPGCDVRIETVTDSTATANVNPRLNGDVKCKFGSYSTFINPIAAEETLKYTNHIHNAAFYLEEKKYQKSLDQYEQALQAYSKNGMDYFMAGIAACQLGENKKASQYIKKAIENNFLDEDRLQTEHSIEPLRDSKYWEGIPDLIKKEKQSYLKKFDKIKDVPFLELVPFKRGNLWGFLSKKTLEVLIQPEFEKVTFGVECLKLKIADRNEIQLYSDNTIKQYYQISPKYFSVKRTIYPQNVDNLPRGGFITNDSCIAFVSNIYDKTSYSFDDEKYENIIDIKGPFLVNGKNYGVVSKDKRMGIIDTDGKPLKGFNFNYFKLTNVSYFKGDGHWFYFEDFSNNYGFINQKGEKRYVNMIDSYPFTSQNRAGYRALIKINSMSNFQVLDFYTMELIHKNIEHQFIRLDLQLKECNQKMNYGARDNLQELFCLVKDKNGNLFYIGEMGKVYRENK
jgi:tetratricopeptide (TPR) repeat protein